MLCCLADAMLASDWSSNSCYCFNILDSFSLYTCQLSQWTVQKGGVAYRKRAVPVRPGTSVWLWVWTEHLFRLWAQAYSCSQILKYSNCLYCKSSGELNPRLCCFKECFFVLLLWSRGSFIRYFRTSSLIWWWGMYEPLRSACFPHRSIQGWDQQGSRCLDFTWKCALDVPFCQVSVL